MSQHTQLLKRVRDTGKELGDLKPVVNLDMAVGINCKEDLVQLCQHKARIFMPACHLLMEEVVDGKCEVGKQCKIKVLFEGNFKQLEFEAGLRSSVNGLVRPAKVVENNGNISELEFTPMIRGPHTLQVTVDGLSILDDPVEVFVTIPPTLLGDPVKSTNTVQEPRGIVISSSGKILISKRTAVVAVGEDGNTVHDIARSTKYSLFGIIMDKNDNIYVVDSAQA